MKRIVSILVTLIILTMILTIPVAGAAPRGNDVDVDDFLPILTADNQGNPPRSGRLIVVTDGPVTSAMADEIGNHGKVHGVIQRYNALAVTPRGPSGRAAIGGLPFVTFVEQDQPRHLTDLGTWDRDLLDVTDVEETGAIGDPDPREVSETGGGVYVAVIDSGLPKNWRDFLLEDRVATDLARAFMGGGTTAEDFVPVDEFNTSNPTNLWERDTNGHGMAVASHVIGFKIAPFVVDGVAPGATIVPLKVFPNGEAFTWSSRIIAAIAYVTELKDSGQIDSVVINMSLVGSEPSVLVRMAINDAIDSGVIVVAAAGNSGEAGMGWPAAYPEVISAGAVGWTEQFRPGTVSEPNFDFWWMQDVTNDPDGSGTSEEQQAYVTFFSSRAIPSLGTAFGIDPQELDVLAPGLWTRAPFRHGPNARLFFIGGTSFSAPLTAGVAALMLEKDASLGQSDVEGILKTTALPMAANDSRSGVLEPFFFGEVYDPAWDTDCGDDDEVVPCDPVGAGLLQADAALGAIP